MILIEAYHGFSDQFFFVDFSCIFFVQYTNSNILKDFFSFVPSRLSCLSCKNQVLHSVTISQINIKSHSTLLCTLGLIFKELEKKEEQ